MVDNKTNRLISSIHHNEKDNLKNFVGNHLKKNELTILIDRFESFSSLKEVWGNLYSSAYDEKKIRYLLSELNEQIENYLIIREHKSDKIKRQFTLVEYYRENNLPKEWKAAIQTVKNELSKQKEENENYTLNSFLIKNEELKYHREHGERAEINLLNSLIEQLDHFYSEKKLELSAEAINLSQLFQEKANLQHLEMILSNNDAQNSLYTNIYRQIITSLQDFDNENAFHLLKKNLKSGFNIYPKKTLRTFYSYIQNYCIRKINSGKSNFMEELFLSYQDMIDNEFLIAEKHLNQYDFKNICTVGLRLNKHSWVIDFIENQSPHLKYDIRDNAVRYNNARCYFHQENYRACKKLLHRVEYTDVVYGLDSRSLLLKTYYELEDVESFYSLCESFKVFIKRNKTLVETQKQIFLNLIKYCKSLFRLRQNGKSAKALQEKIIEHNSQIADKSWFDEKIAEMI